MKSAHKIRIDFQNHLKEIYTREEIDQLFFIFLEEIYQIDKVAYFKDTSRPLPFEKFQEIVLRLKNHEPWQYILGKTEFHGLRLKVNSHVLIPRPETEELVVLITGKFKENPPRKILDIGSGSGAIALSLKKNFPKAEVWALDFKEEILDIIRHNAKQNHLDIQTVSADILKDNFDISDFNLIVSNPPYVLPAEKKYMKPNVLKFEPHDALFVSENNPIIFYKKIIALFQSTKPGSWLYFELNPETAINVKNYAGQKHLKIKLFNDLSNKIRFAEIKKV